MSGNQKLRYDSEDKHILTTTIFVVSDFAGDPVSRKSATGFVAQIWHAHGEIWFYTSEFDSADRGTSGVLSSGERRSRGTIRKANMHGSGNSK